MTLHHSGFGVAADRVSAHDRATRMLAFSKARIAAFAPFDLAINDIAWELLLGLFVAQEKAVQLSAYALCDPLDMPRTVSIRWLRALAACGLIDYDERGGLAAAVSLTAAGDRALRGLIEA